LSSLVYVKLIILLCVATLAACGVGASKRRFVIAESKSYEASLFRQNCAICHGPEADGKRLPDGTMVPSLREGNFKFHTEPEVYNQIANGGNGMVPHRYQLSERELRLLTRFVREDLRGNK